jgi:hypothetical protein
MPSGRPAPYLMTQDEVLELLRIDARQPNQAINRIRREGHLPAIRVGKRNLFRSSDVRTMIDQMEAV